MTTPSRDATAVARFLLDHAEYLKSIDMRVGQFISNVAQYMGFDGDPYYMENNKLLEGMRRLVNEMQKTSPK